MKSILKCAWVMLWRRRLSSLLTMAGIAVGTGLVVLILGISNVGTATIQNELESMGINGISVSSTGGLTGNCLAVIRTLPMVSKAMPLLIQYGFADVRTERYNIVGCGIDAGADQVISLNLLHGRLLRPEDVNGEAEVCVVDETLAKDAFGRTNVVGEKVAVLIGNEEIDMTVVGVTAADSSLLQSVTSMIPYMLYAPYTTVQFCAGVDTFDQIAVRVNNADNTEAAREMIDSTLKGIDDDIGVLSTENLATQRQHLDTLVSVVSAALTAIGAVSLLVSAFGIMTMMLSSVNERTREIGVKKAIGATKGRIMSEFLTGALLMSGIGALVGMTVGVGALTFACFVLGLHVQWSVWQLGGILLLTLLLGAVFGVYPAHQASQLRPVEALRHDG